MHLRLNLVAQLDQFQFARQMLVHVRQPRPHVHLLEHCLPLGMAQAGQNAGHQIRQAPELVGVGDAVARSSERLGDALTIC